MYNLALMYQEGTGVKKDTNKTLHLMETAAAQGLAQVLHWEANKPKSDLDLVISKSAEFCEYILSTFEIMYMIIYCIFRPRPI